MSAITISPHGHPSLYVGRLPGRKRQAIAIVTGNHYDPIAYLRDEQSAEALKELLCVVLRAAPTGRDE